MARKVKVLLFFFFLRSDIDDQLFFSMFCIPNKFLRPTLNLCNQIYRLLNLLIAWLKEKSNRRIVCMFRFVPSERRIKMPQSYFKIINNTDSLVNNLSNYVQLPYFLYFFVLYSFLLNGVRLHRLSTRKEKYGSPMGFGLLYTELHAIKKKIVRNSKRDKFSLISVFDQNVVTSNDKTKILKTFTD